MSEKEKTETECLYTKPDGWHEYTKTQCGAGMYSPSDRWKYCPMCGKKIRREESKKP